MKALNFRENWAFLCIAKYIIALCSLISALPKFDQASPKLIFSEFSLCFGIFYEIVHVSLFSTFSFFFQMSQRDMYKDKVSRVSKVGKYKTREKFLMPKHLLSINTAIRMQSLSNKSHKMSLIIT